MGQLTVALKDEVIASLRKEFDSFVRVSGKLDPRFTPPSFDDFLRAKLLDSHVPLTEKAVEQLLAGGQYAWAKRTFDKEFPDVVAILMRQASQFGFGFAVRSDWSQDQLLQAAREWAKSIVEEAGADAALVESLAAQITAAAQDIRALEESMQTGAWRLGASLRPRVYEAKEAVEHGSGSAAREKLGELRALLRLGVSYGTISKPEANQIIEYLHLLKPAIFADEPYDVFTRLAAWLRRLCTATPRAKH